MKTKTLLFTSLLVISLSSCGKNSKPTSESVDNTNTNTYVPVTKNEQENYEKAKQSLNDLNNVDLVEEFELDEYSTSSDVKGKKNARSFDDCYVINKSEYLDYSVLTEVLDLENTFNTRLDRYKERIDEAFSSDNVETFKANNPNAFLYNDTKSNEYGYVIRVKQDTEFIAYTNGFSISLGKSSAYDLYVAISENQYSVYRHYLNVDLTKNQYLQYYRDDRCFFDELLISDQNEDSKSITFLITDLQGAKHYYTMNEDGDKVKFNHTLYHFAGQFAGITAYMPTTFVDGIAISLDLESRPKEPYFEPIGLLGNKNTNVFWAIQFNDPSSHGSISYFPWTDAFSIYSGLVDGWEKMYFAPNFIDENHDFGFLGYLADGFSYADGSYYETVLDPDVLRNDRAYPVTSYIFDNGDGTYTPSRPDFAGIVSPQTKHNTKIFYDVLNDILLTDNLSLKLSSKMESYLKSFRCYELIESHMIDPLIDSVALDALIYKDFVSEYSCQSKMNQCLRNLMSGYEHKDDYKKALYLEVKDSKGNVSYVTAKMYESYTIGVFYLDLTPNATYELKTIVGEKCFINKCDGKAEGLELNESGVFYYEGEPRKIALIVRENGDGYYVEKAYADDIEMLIDYYGWEPVE